MRTGRRVFLKNDIVADLKKSCAEFVLFFSVFKWSALHSVPLRLSLSHQKHGSFAGFI